GRDRPAGAARLPSTPSLRHLPFVIHSLSSIPFVLRHSSSALPARLHATDSLRPPISIEYPICRPQPSSPTRETTMTRTTPKAAKRLALVLLTSALTVGGLSLARAKVETWRHDGASAFNRGKKERVVIADSGRMRLGHAVKAVGNLEAAQVWDLAR